MDQNQSESMEVDKTIEGDTDKVLQVHVLMDIAKNIGTLKSELGQLLPNKNLSDYDVWLTGEKVLETSCLVDFCQTVDGLVLVNVDIIVDQKLVVIRDVVQPPEDLLKVTQREEGPIENMTMNDTTPNANVNDSEDNKTATGIQLSGVKRLMRIDEIDSQKSRSPPKPRFIPRQNDGKIELWVFLLELLTDKKYRNIIQWIGNDGKFKLLDPKEIARIWGLRKGHREMCYEHLSRGLRYYYKKEYLLTKDGCENYAYKFTFDIKDVLGYEPQQLGNILNGQSRQPRPRRFPKYELSDMDDDIIDTTPLLFE